MKKIHWQLTQLIKRRNIINSKPDYQRTDVWTKAQRQLFIDSLLRGYDVPKFYLHEVPGAFNVVDGKQRIKTILDYFDDKFPLGKGTFLIDGYDVSGLTYSELPKDISDKLDLYKFDITIYDTETEDEIIENFRRLQNGTPLNGQEKRNAIKGKMRDFVRKVANHDFFYKVNFKENRYMYDLIAAKMVLIALKGEICTVKDKDLTQIYREYATNDINFKTGNMIFKILNYMDKMFSELTPELTRYNVVSLFILFMDLLSNYDIKGRQEQLHEWFINFEKERNIDKEKETENQNPVLVSYQNWISQGSDTAESLRFRHSILKESLLKAIPDLALKDPKRDFDEAQRQVIYRRDNGICQMCGAECEWNKWEADHVKPWNRGGQTKIENGQVLCEHCNSVKHDTISE